MFAFVVFNNMHHAYTLYVCYLPYLAGPWLQCASARFWKKAGNFKATRKNLRTDALCV